jgi:hypothetical protein
MALVELDILIISAVVADIAIGACKNLELKCPTNILV